MCYAIIYYIDLVKNVLRFINKNAIPIQSVLFLIFLLVQVLEYFEIQKFKRWVETSDIIICFENTPSFHRYTFLILIVSTILSVMILINKRNKSSNLFIHFSLILMPLIILLLDTIKAYLYQNY